MEFKELMQSFAAKLGMASIDIEDDFAAIEIDGMAFGFIHNPGKETLTLVADLGQAAIDANGEFGEVMLKSNHLYLGTNGGTLCQNPDTDAYVLMRPVPLAPLEGADTFGAIMEDVLLQVDNWRELLNGLRAAEVQEEEQSAEEGRLASGGFMQVSVKG